VKRSLSEAQVVRFSRQILLREVGGAGQARLCGTPVAVSAESPADLALWLAAGGAPIAVDDRRLRADEAGFLGAPGARLHEALVGRGGGLANEASVWVRTAPCEPSLPEGAGVVLGAGHGGMWILFAGSRTCRACLATSVKDLREPPAAQRELGAALAALAVQRGVLSLSPGEGILCVGADGAPGPCVALRACGAHR
jgi:hypothetical protein